MFTNCTLLHYPKHDTVLPFQVTMWALGFTCILIFVSNKAKGRLSKRVFQENKTCQIFQKKNISYPLICTHTCAYQGVRNVRVCFLETSVLRFALLPNYQCFDAHSFSSSLFTIKISGSWVYSSLFPPLAFTITCTVIFFRQRLVLFWWLKSQSLKMFFQCFHLR